MGNLGASELLIIAVVVVLLFGAGKMPQMARSLGQSIRILKAETKAAQNDDQQIPTPQPQPPAAPPQPPTNKD